MTTRPDSHRPRLDPEVEGLLIDRARGELGPREASRLEAWLKAHPEQQGAAARVETFLRAAGEALPQVPEPDQAARLVARVREQAEAESARERREATAPARSRRLVWARVLAVSVGLHVVLLGALVFKSRQQEPRDGTVRISVELPAPGILPESETYEPAPSSPWLPARGELDLPDARLAAADVAEAIDAAYLEPLEGNRYAHAPSVSGPMRVRTEDALKRGRLQLLGFDADGTLKAVGRGLRALEERQAPDGSFPAGGGRRDVGQTALALLPFLGEGHGSRTREAASRPVVAKGIAWVRRRLFDGSERETDGASVADLGIALKALAEDYMLSYGRLRPVEAQRRAVELERLTERIVAAQDAEGRFPGAEEDVRSAVWPMWGLEAAARSGAVLPPAIVAERFRSWFGSRPRTANEELAAGLLLARTLGASYARESADRSAERLLAHGIDAEDDAFVLATTGTGLLLHDATAFRTWSRGLDDKLIRSLLQTGVVREGDVIGDTATVLLALQVAYRTY